MSSVNIQGVNKDSFGTKMPNVFVNRIELDYGGPDEYGDGSPITVFTCHLSIRFSKPDYIQAGSVKEFIKTYLDDVCLYAYITYKDWIKKNLEENKFSIEYWHKVGQGEHSVAYVYERFKRIKLSDFIAEDNSYESVLNVGLEFDENGNEIIEISNIKLEMQYKYSTAGGTFGVPLLNNVENLMFFTYTGIKTAGKYDVADTYWGTYYAVTGDTQDDEGLFTSRFSEADDAFEIERLSESLNSNSYFSDISYYHILKNNRIATKFFEAYITPAGIPYFDQVLQSTNGNFYATDNYSFDNIKSTLEALIDSHKDNREADDDLNKNLSNLELIINATDNKSGVLTELSGYRATYPNKSPTSFSGEFYGEFLVAFAEIIQAVQAQEQLDVKQLYDSLVIDNRFSFVVGEYTPPDPSGLVDGLGPTSGIQSDDVIRGVPYSSPSGCYLPENWFYLTRKAYLTNSVSSYSEEELTELYGITDQEDFTEEFSDESDVLARMLSELKDNYIEQGFSREDADLLAREQLSYDFSTGVEGEDPILGEMGSTKSELLNPTLNGGSYVDLRAGDSIVKNSGLFLFDYEKAIRTQSIIAHTFDITLLQKLFRINIPYSHFWVKQVELSRNELRLDAEDIEDYFSKYIRTKMITKFKTPNEVASSAARAVYDYRGEYYDYPHNDKTSYSYFGGKDVSEAESTNEIFAQKIKYLRPSFKLGSYTYTSNLKFINFDIPTTDEQKKLKNYNSLDDRGVGLMNFDSLNPGESTLRALDGYRIMAFQFSDFTDDDVAYYNTIDVDSDYRTPLIEDSNNLGEARTCYSTTVEIVDQTQVTYDNFVSYIVDEYNSFNEYYQRASDICNYNNITNEFNQFFVDSINEIFSDNFVWYRAAYVANALGKILFSSDETFDKIRFEENLLETIIRISPETGNLYQLNSFAENFKNLIEYITINNINSTSPPSDDTMTPVKRIQSFAATDTPEGAYGRILQFYNEKPIWEPIAGDITPDDSPTPSANKTALPEFAVSSRHMRAITVDADVDLFSYEASDPWKEVGQIYPDTYATAGMGTAATAEEGDTAAYIGVTNARKVIELVFFPKSFGTVFVNNLIAFYQMDWIIYAGSGVGDPTYDDYSFDLSRSSSATKPDDAPLEYDLTWAAYFINEIMTYTTTDVEIFTVTPGTWEIARLKPGLEPSGDYVEPRSRRSYRNVAMCLAVVHRIKSVLILTAAEMGDVSYLSDTDGVDHTARGPSFYSSEYREQNTFFSALADASDARADSHYQAEIQRRLIYRALKITERLESILAAILGGDEDQLYEYGIDQIVNPDDPIGPTSGTLGFTVGDTGVEIDISDLL